MDGRVRQRHQRVEVHAQARRRVATQVLVRHEQDLLVLLARPIDDQVRVRAGAHRSAGGARDRLDATRRVHVRDDEQVVAVALDQLVRGREHHVVLGQHLHRAAGLRIRDPDVLVVVREDRDGLGHEVHGRLDDDLLLGVARSLERERVAVRHRATVTLDQLHDLATHVVVGEEQQRVAEVLLRRTHVPVEPGQHRLRRAIGQRQVLLGVGLQLVLVPVERKVGLADRNAGLEREA